MQRSREKRERRAEPRPELLCNGVQGNQLSGGQDSEAPSQERGLAIAEKQSEGRSSLASLSSGTCPLASLHGMSHADQWQKPQIHCGDRTVNFQE